MPGGRITHLYPQPYGPKLVLADEQFTVGLFSPLTDEISALPGYEGILNVVGNGAQCWTLMLWMQSLYTAAPCLMSAMLAYVWTGHASMSCCHESLCQCTAALLCHGPCTQGLCTTTSYGCSCTSLCDSDVPACCLAGRCCGMKRTQTSLWHATARASSSRTC